MLYGMGKYVFVVTTVPVKGEDKKVHTKPPHCATNASVPAQPSRGLALKSWVRLIGHADVRWHLWIVLAAIGRLDVALVFYAAYFPLRALGSAVGKVVRHA
jgi:hypothetical protein